MCAASASSRRRCAPGRALIKQLALSTPRESPFFIGKSPLRHTVEVGIRDGVGALRSKGDKRECPHRIWKHSDLLPR